MYLSIIIYTYICTYWHLCLSCTSTIVSTSIIVVMRALRFLPSVAPVSSTHRILSTQRVNAEWTEDVPIRHPIEIYLGCDYLWYTPMWDVWKMIPKWLMGWWHWVYHIQLKLVGIANGRHRPKISETGDHHSLVPGSEVVGCSVQAGMFPHWCL